MNEGQKMYIFNPQYLKELRIQHRNKLDEELVEWTKQKILKANLSGNEGTRIAFRVDSAWERLIEHFRGLGFYVGSSGYTTKQYDDEGNQVYFFDFSWNFKGEGNNNE